MTRYTYRDAYGVARTGPKGAWWVSARDGVNPAGVRPRHELPTARIVGWNVVAVSYLGMAVGLAWRLGELWWFLVVLAVLVAATAAAIAWTGYRHQPRATRPRWDEAAAEREAVRVAIDAARQRVAA